MTLDVEVTADEEVTPNEAVVPDKETDSCAIISSPIVSLLFLISLRVKNYEY